MPDDRKPPRKPPQKRPATGRTGPGARARARGPRARAPRPEFDDAVVLYGWHPVTEALRNDKRVVHRLLATENAARRLAEELPEAAASPQIVRPSEIDALLGPDAVHQGLYAEAEPLVGYDLDTLPDDALVLALDQVTDPHNVGAIVRTAAAFGVTAILTTARHSPAATGVLAKSASGGLEHVPFVVVGNLGDALDRLGKRGFLRIGLDSDGAETFENLAARRPALLVLGAEGKGLRVRTRGLCDVVARLDMAGAIKSLNVSNAAAIALYALTRRL
ncbi:MAG: TrmH family RNA methyltransferase [Salinarimonas sp.]